MLDEWSSTLTRRLEQVLHVHPEKYRARSNRTSRNNTPVSHVSQRSHSIDYMNSSVSDNVPASRVDSVSAKCHVPMIPEEYDTEKPVQIPLNPNRLRFHANTGDIITINVAGMRFQTWESTLERFPDTLLGHPVKRSKFWNSKRQEYFIDRHRSCFESILYIYQSGGRIKRPESVPIDLFLRELKFYQMGEEVLEEFWISEGYEKPKENEMPKNSYQRRLWELMEYPDSSLSARIIAFVSVFVIVTSIISFCLETIPELKPKNEETRDWSNPFFWIEFLCIIWFSIELLLRFLSCPSKITFLKSFLNIVDFIAIAPFFVNLMWSDAGNTSSSMSFAVLRVLRLVRVFRIFKLSRHSVGLQILGKTFKASVQEFCLLIFFMVIALVLFSSGVYFAEQSEPNTKFTSIPASFWFVLVTMTTVGYGDLVPTGTYGKLVGSCCALIGVLTLALPVPIIVANFKHFYRQETRLATMRASRESDDGDNASYGSEEEDDSIS